MNSAESFSSDYQTARAKFLAAARDAGAELEATPHPERGPDGGDLTTDIAWIGPREAEAVLVMISATHGVEGFCGSGAQVDWLRREEYRALPSSTAVLMVHAINPYAIHPTTQCRLRKLNESIDVALAGSEAALARGDITVLGDILDELLDVFGINLDRRSDAFRKLGGAVLREHVRALRDTEARSKGTPITSPRLDAPTKKAEAADGHTIRAALKGWAKATRPAPSTLREFGHAVDRFVEAAYWLPLLGMFTGARLGELAPLRVTDVQEDAGSKTKFLAIRVIVEEGKRLKTTSSTRAVPVHPELVRLGFLEYVEEARKQNSKALLFPALKPGPHGGLGESWSKWFGRYIRVNGITNKKAVFHSFRHGFKDALRRAKLGEDINDALTGHSGGGTGRKYGAKDMISRYGAEALQEAVSKVVYPGVDFSRLPILSKK